MNYLAMSAIPFFRLNVQSYVYWRSLVSHRRHLFITKNNFLKEITNDNFDANGFRFRNLAKAFADHQTRELSENRSYPGMPSTHGRMGIYGHLKAALAFSKTCTIDRAMESVKKIGQRPFNPDHLINNLFIHMKREDRQAFKEALPRGSQVYSANGAITSVEMDSLNVPNNDDKCDSNIDNLPMSRRRCARPTNEEQWRVILSQKETREARKRKSVKRKKAQNDEDEDKPTKVFKPYKNRAKKQKL